VRIAGSLPHSALLLIASISRALEKFLLCVNAAAFRARERCCLNSIWYEDGEIDERYILQSGASWDMFLIYEIPYFICVAAAVTSLAERAVIYSFAVTNLIATTGFKLSDVRNDSDRRSLNSPAEQWPS
jgi:hypothetical protein